MKRTILLCATLVLAVIATFAANGKKDYIVGNFTGIQLTGSPTIIVTQGKTTSVKAEGPQELIDLLEIKVDGKDLIVKQKSKSKIRFFGRNNMDNNYVKVYVEVPSLQTLSISGSGDIIVKEGMKWDSSTSMSISGSGDIEVALVNTESLNLYLKGSGDIDIKTVKVKYLDATVSGSGDIEVRNTDASTVKAYVKGSGDIDFKAGKAKQAEYKVSGSGDIHAHNLKVDQVNAEVSGSGDIRCQAKQSISGKVSGSGDVSYSGKPNQVNVSKKGFHAVK